MMAASSTAEAPRALPGDSDVWVFVIGDMLIFSAYFAAYLFVDRSQDHALFLESQKHLSQDLGIVNTLVLLTSSLFVARSVQAAKAGDHAAAARRLTTGGLFGSAFLCIKAFEWTSKIAGGITLTTNAFFMHYYMLTSVHVAHVLLGLVFLSLARRELQRASAPNLGLIEAGGIYWHMVDFLWILIFALLYLMR